MSDEVEVTPAEDPIQDATTQNFWDEMRASALEAMQDAGITEGQIITLSTPTGQTVTIPVEGVTSIRNLISNQGFVLSPSAQFIVDGTYVPMDHEVAPGAHVVVSVPLKAG